MNDIDRPPSASTASQSASLSVLGLTGAAAGRRAPLYNMGAECTPQKSNETALPASESDPANYDRGLLVGFRGWSVGCDKLRLGFSRVASKVSWADGVIGGAWSNWRRGRNRGAYRSEWRTAWTGDVGAKVFWQHERTEGVTLEDLIVEFSPLHLGAMGLVHLGYALRALGITPAEFVLARVERVDVCWDRAEDRYGYRLDSRRCKPDGIGQTGRGFQTERLGYHKGSKLKVRVYDRHAKERRRDVPQLRAEVEVWPEETVRVAGLAELACPAGPDASWSLVKLMHPGSFADQRYMALGCVCAMMGTRVARKAAEEILGRREVATAEFALWDDVTPSLAAAFERTWATVVDRVIRGMGFVPVAEVA